MKCVASCSGNKLLLEDGQFSFSRICRNPIYYINPQSSNLYEIGTKEYPFRTFKSVASEVLNHLSYKSINVTILLKEETKVYIEDDTSYFLGLESVTISSYSDESDLSKRAIIVPTVIPQLGLLKRANLNILTHADLRISSTIAKGVLSLNQFRQFQ
jgi:hypothetical protein